VVLRAHNHSSKEQIKEPVLIHDHSSQKQKKNKIISLEFYLFLKAIVFYELKRIIICLDFKKFLLKAIVFCGFKRIIHTLVSTMKVSHRFEVKDLR
jgi:hypothetical protein